MRVVPRSNRRRAFALVLLLAVVLFVELAAHAIYLARFGALHTRAGLTRHLEARADGADPFATGADEMAEIAQRRILHPFFGYAFDRAETLGAAGRVSPMQTRSDDRFVVAVTGGSVANQVRTALADALEEALRERGVEREVVVVGLAIDGFKQPQQLAQLTYFLSLGAEYDAVVNIDGFNDIVLPLVDNHERGVFPFYPRSWNSFVNRRPSQQMLLGAGEIAYLRTNQRERIERVQGAWWGRSAVAGLWHATRLEQSATRIAERQRALLAARETLPFEASGPEFAVDDVAEVYDAAAELWARSSILLHHLLEGRGIGYLHVLQPNQYVEGSRDLTPEERSQAFDPAHPYAKVAARGYHYLFDAAESLVAAGVPFRDATRIFADVPEPIYNDTCCHVNRAGKQLFARSVARWLLASLPSTTGAVARPAGPAD